MIFTDKRKFSLLKNLYDIPFHFETGRQEKGKYRMKRKDLQLLLFFFLCMMFLFSCKKKANRQEDKAYTYKRSKENIELNIWSYYSALQQEVFLKTVDEFNLTRGKDLNITVHVMSPGSMNDLEANLFALTDKNFAQGTYPDMAFMYRDTGKVLDQKGYLVNLSNYLTKKEMDDFVPGFLEEGRLGNQREGIKILPVAKSTEVFYLNATAWKSFSDATGAILSDLDTREGLIEVAKKYYEYTDALTPEEGDGKAFFGQEDFATYFLVGAKQMGVDLVSVDASGKVIYNFPEDVLHKLWDYFYVPYIKGYFGSSGRYRSDDLRTGEIISYVSTSASYSYFPEAVILSDQEYFPIEATVLPAPDFVKGQKIAIQQGAGIGVLKGDEQKIKASIEFLRWLTSESVNSNFALSADYLPVRSDSLTVQTVDVIKGRGTNPAIEEALKTVSSHTMYYIPAADNISMLREILENTLKDKAIEDKKAIETAVASGLSKEDAVGEYDTEENFTLWYESLLSEIEGIKG